MNLRGSICLSDIPREQIKKANNGKLYVNIRISERREPDVYGNTHNIDCKPKKEERIEGVNYYIGKAQHWQPVEQVTPQDIDAAPAADSLPWEDNSQDPF